MANLAASSTSWTIEIHIEDSSQPIRLYIENELVLGRVDPNQAVFDGFDLTPYRAEHLGISRRHALLRQENDLLTITDLDSRNGTVLNGTRLQANMAYPLAKDNTLILGHLKMNIHLNDQFDKLLIRAKRIDLSTINIPLKAHGQRILTVDDDVETAKLYQTALEELGFTVQMCRDVVSAIRALNQTTPSLMLVELALSTIPGIELCRYVRRDTECSSIPIVAVSSLDDERTLKQAMEAEVDVYLQKPVDLKQLARMISAIVHKSETENPLLHTKKLTHTASLDYIAGMPRNDTIVIFVAGNREPICSVVQKQIILGRSGVKVTDRSIIDLETYGGLEEGISRNHALLKRQGELFLLEDIGSYNGTFLNGVRLAPRVPQLVKNGDEIQLGSLHMNIYLLADTSYKEADPILFADSPN